MKFISFCLLMLSVISHAETTISPVDSPQLRFALAEIKSAARGANQTVPEITIELKTGPAQSYQIEREGSKVRVIGGDANGAMYGGLDVAEAVRLGTLAELKGGEHKPHIAKRGIKLNVPLDLRTPSYSDSGDAAQANIPEMWKREFWTELLDGMARNRYNVLSLWNLHPFPSMVKVPEFPDVALDDVWRTREKLPEATSFKGTLMAEPDLLANHEVVKKMGIDEKIAFWRWMMQYAQERGIQVYIFTWNVFIYGAEGKHGITDSLENDITKKYYRTSVREMVKTYPLLAGMGITAGEAMPRKISAKIKEAWLWDTYGEGVRDALKDEPKRVFPLIHRLHWADEGVILNAFKDYPGPFEFSFKYSMAHMYSIPNPPFIQPILKQLTRGRKTWLTVRNDDIYSFRFGDPVFTRNFIVNIPPAEKIAGFYMGSDGYTWGREFIDRNPAPGPRPLVMEKQWYSFMLWGRLAYEPQLPDSHFEKVLAARHPKADSKSLYKALQGASQVMPLVNRFFWKPNDYQFFPEACSGHPTLKGFYTVKDFMDGVSMEGSYVLSIRAWLKKLAAKEPMKQTTPLQIADALEAAAEETIHSIEGLRKASEQDLELKKTLNDCEALSWLGRYYSAKIRAACSLAQFDASDDKVEREASIRSLTDALSHWKQYAAVRDGQYLPALYARVGYVDITALTTNVAEDIKIAQSWKPSSSRSAPRASAGPEL